MPTDLKESKDLKKELTQPLTPEQILELLHENLHLTESDLGRLLDVSDRSIRRWMADFRGDSDAHEALLDIADVVVLLLNTGLPEPNAKSWLLRRNRFLKNDRPIDAFKNDREAVLGAANAMLDGVYA